MCWRTTERVRDRNQEHAMRIVREYLGIDRTTVVYDNDISGVGGNADEFFVVAEAKKINGTIAARTTITFSHDEVARILADYRHHYPIDNTTKFPLISGPRHERTLGRLRRRLSGLLRRGWRIG
jgi:hypothetical protein